jgi:hypothetical protein
MAGAAYASGGDEATVQRAWGFDGDHQDCEIASNNGPRKIGHYATGAMRCIKLSAGSLFAAILHTGNCFVQNRENSPGIRENPPAFEAWS